jgi:predicted permease
MMRDLMLRRLRALFRRREVDRAMDDEMRFHVDMEAAELERFGMEPGEALRRAKLAFGAHDRFREEGREARGLSIIHDVVADTMYALRALRRAPVFTLVAVAALGLAIGANAVVFGMVDAAAFRPLAVASPDRLHAMFATDADGGFGELSYPAYRDLREGVNAFQDVAAFVEQPLSVGDARGSDVEWSALVTPNYFDVLGATALHGRLLGPADERQPVVVLGHAIWQRRFGGDASVVGRTVQLNGYPWTVVGVLPERFTGTRLFSYAPGVWMPVGMHEQARPASAGMLDARAAARFNVVGRLRNGVTPAQATGEANAVAARLAAAYPTEHPDLRIRLIPNRTPINPWLAPPERIRAAGLLALVGVGLVLMIACADVANLLLARMTTRRREIAIRLSLGAARGRLLRQFLTESVVLALLGCAAALPAALLALSAADALQPPLDFATAYTPVFDARVILFAGAVAVAAAIVFGLAPAVHALRPGVAAALRSQGAGATGRRGLLRESLVVMQVAMSVLVLVSAGLFVRGLQHARAIDPGFDADGALVFTLDPQLARGYDVQRSRLVYDELTDRLRELPGVRAVAITSGVPLDGSGSATRIFADGRISMDDAVTIDYHVVAGDYLAAFGMPLVAGRMFQQQDVNRDIEPIVINSVLAERLWPGESALGRRLRTGTPDGDVLQVVGIVPAMRWRSLSESPRAGALFSALHSDRSRMTVVVRADGDPLSHIPAVREVLRAIDPTLPVVGMKTLRDHIAVSYSAVESGAVTATSFGILALLLAAAGIYGVLSYLVAQRAREFAIRMALGARSRQLLGLVFSRALVLTGIGVIVGVLVALPVTRTLGGLLYGVSTHDPVVFGSVVVLLAGVAAIATAVPAVRAMRVEPMRALRLE